MRRLADRSVVLSSGLLSTAVVLLICSSAHGQAVPQFSTVEPHQYDSINLGTLGIQLNVPIRSKAGHIPYSYRLIGASQITLVKTAHGTWLQANPALTGGESHISQNAGYSSTTICHNSQGEYYGTVENGFYATDALGTTHQFGFSLGSPAPSCDPQTTAGGYAVDNSGLYLSVNFNNGSPIYTLWDMSGDNSTVTGGGVGYFSTLSDPNGNTISGSTDSLGQTALTISGSPNSPPQTFVWTDALNNNQTMTVTSSSYTMYTAFGCSADFGPVPQKFPTSISLPDGSTMSFSWENDPLNTADYTGRIASITLPTGGKITYAYSGGTNGINCLDGTPATMTRTTPDGQWVYTHVASTTSPTTTLQDPQGNFTVYTFVMATVRGSGTTLPLETEKQVYNLSVAPQNLIETVITCYNNTSSSPSNCNPANLSANITEKDVYTTYPGVTGYSAVKTAYDTYGRVTDVKTFDFNAASPTNEKQIAYGTGSPSSQTCSAISTYIIDKPCSITLLDSQHNNAILSQTWNSYDSHGNLLQSWDVVSGSGSSGTYLSKQYTYDSHGVVQTMTDVNGQVMNYTTTSCNNKFVTSQYPTNFPNLQTSQNWDCNGGVVTSETDANGQTAQTKFYVNSQTDFFYRPLQRIDELSYITTLAYTSNPNYNMTESIFTFNSGQSVIDQLSTTDNIGRPLIAQVLQAPGSSTWDAKSRSFDASGRVYQRSLTCVSGRGTGCSASTESQTYDALNRPLVHTGTGGDVTTKSYPANDVLTTLTPAPNNEHAKSVQKEYDGLGRLKSVCVISGATGSGSCGQTNSETGFLTTYSYDAAGRLLQSVENAQVSSPQQPRSYTYDLLGRILTESNPESGSRTYTYDTVSGTNCTSTSQGDLVQEVDANGNYTCHHYDGLHRETYTTYAGPNSNNVSKYFVYDSATVNGTAMSNAEGRLAEAYTCAGSNPPPCSPKITDDGFSYDARGQMSDYYQSSPNSGGYYHLSATHWEDGQVKAISGVGLPTITYGGLDGEGRVTTVTASSGTNPVSGVTYNNGSYSNEPIGALLTTTLGTSDSENFTFDKNTGRMTSYAASVGSTPVTISGTLNWNPNGTLAENNIVDGYNSADTQDCKYLYDDFMRIASGLDGTPGVNCLTGSTKIWNQTFSYGSDAFGNLTKSTSGPGMAWMPGYNTANNHYTLGGTAYDSDGNLTADTFHNYTWLADGHVATVVTGATTASITYDAEGNKVEENIGGTIHEYVSAFGVSAQMTGQTEKSTLVNLPGGLQALYSGGTLQRFRFPDWQGTIRAESSPSTRQFTESLAFAPFGERYAQKGTPYNVDSFTGKPDQIVSDEYDFPAREEHNGQGRWISPDPMRGTGNKYVYADNNPLSNVDVYGLSPNIGYLPVGADLSLQLEYLEVLAESSPPVSIQTGGQTTPTSTQNPGISPATGTQTPQNQQGKQAQQKQKQAEPAKPAVTFKVTVRAYSFTFRFQLNSLSMKFYAIGAVSNGLHHGIPRQWFKLLDKGGARSWFEKFTTDETAVKHGWSTFHKAYNEAVGDFKELGTEEGRQNLVKEGAEGAMKVGRKLLDSPNPDIKGFLDENTTSSGLTFRQSLERALQGDAEAAGDLASGTAGVAVKDVVEDDPIP